MSQFDFPRINFAGRAFINPGTANNNVLLPLLTYDPIAARPVLPPRIYLTPDLLRLHKLGGLPVPEQQRIHTDTDGQRYLEIEPVDTAEKFQTWMTTPLGDCSLDKDFHALYPLVKVKRSGLPLSGHLPANWNYYGGMEFGFREVRVGSVEAPVASGKPVLYSGETPDCPPDIAALLGAALDMAHDNGRTAAVMIDVLPTLALYSQVFCDMLRLKKGDMFFLKGRPRKGSLRFLNLERIVNQEGVIAASGTFFSVIPAAEVEGGDQSPLLAFFRKYSRDERPIRGVFLRYNLFEVSEDQMPDYRQLGARGNPATASVAGSLTPWYEEDMCSIGMGRQLAPEGSFAGGKKLAPLVCRVDAGRQVVVLDLLGSIPEARLDESSGFETYPLGPLRLALLDAAGIPDRTLGSFRINAEHYPRAHWLHTSGILEIPLPAEAGLNEALLEDGTLAVFADAGGQKAPLLRECAFMLASDQAGMYAEAGQDPQAGYRCYGADREACSIRVYHKGKPFAGVLPMTVMELRMTASAASAAVQPFLRTAHFRDGQTLDFPTTQAANAMYVFFPGAPPDISKDMVPEVLRTGFFVNLRVLPRRDYGKYLDPKHPEYPTPVPFELIYRELLEPYVLTLPVSAIITPFTEDYFRKGWLFIRQRMAPGNWASASYMPSTRDMPEGLWALLCRWGASVDG